MHEMCNHVGHKPSLGLFGIRFNDRLKWFCSTGHLLLWASLPCRSLCSTIGYHPTRTFLYSSIHIHIVERLRIDRCDGLHEDVESSENVLGNQEAQGAQRDSTCARQPSDVF